MAERGLDALCSLAGVLFPPVAADQSDSPEISAYKQLDGQELRGSLRNVSICRY